MSKHSAGLLAYRKNGDRLVEVLIAHMGGPFHAKKEDGHWTIPKGEYDEGEDPKAVAKREFSEELGKAVPDGEWLDLGEVQYLAGSKKGKKVTTWAVEADVDVNQIKSNTFKLEWPPRSGKTQEFAEIDRAGYFPLNIAAKKLIPAQAEFMSRLAEKLAVPMMKNDEPQEPAQASLF